jgi:heptose-I-phosphate ethanolaminephosphotransferase
MFVFRDVIAPHPATAASLEKALSFWEPANGDVQRRLPIFDLFKAGGFRTTWISNQPRRGLWETVVAALVSGAEAQLWLNQNEGGIHEYRFRSPPDANVLPALAEALKGPEREKFIAIHLLGTHVDYRRRYPPEYNVFKGPVPGRSPSQSTLINEYDNAALYNDAIVAEIIRLVEARSRKAMVLYFSDHGEEVFDYRGYRGRGGAGISRFVTDIPFLVWVSEEHRRDHQRRFGEFEGYLDRSFSIAYLTHALADIAGLSFAGFDERLSLFSERFAPQPRFVGSTSYEEIQQRSPAAIAGSLTQAPAGCRS